MTMHTLSHMRMARRRKAMARRHPWRARRRARARHRRAVVWAGEALTHTYGTAIRKLGHAWADGPSPLVMMVCTPGDGITFMHIYTDPRPTRFDKDNRLKEEPNG